MFFDVYVVQRVILVLSIGLGVMKFFLSWIGAQDVPHVESSDSEQSYRDADSETSESDEDVEEEINIDVEREYPKVPPPKVLILPSGAKKWIPSCDKIYKPRTSQHFPTLEDAFLFLSGIWAARWV